MQINLLKDLIIDEYGNYYVAVKAKTGGGKPSEYTLVSAFMEIAFSSLITEEYYKEHQYEYVGRYILDLLKNHIEYCKSEGNGCKIIQLSELQKSCKVYFDPFFERNPSVK
ncbi:hypothetical protein H1164_13170 [Thermoactinomyces daqus]|uniref:Uncharacterized protein n=1 Tax=Thermoactinomyces daqus TaxID=1329516 RepID=A0A7W2AJJ6_9BACL|nr:hypothetical protein [Thermoactinomyces daqus]MBA4543839.1 hypothetical protein [Thermoactinomyces daqus]